MVSRRKFTIGIGVFALNLLIGCDNKVMPVINAVPDIFSLFWSNPIVKLLSFLKIIDTTLSEIYRSDVNSNMVIVRFETKNPGVDGLIRLSLRVENELYRNEYCDFIIPNDNVVSFSPVRFMTVNNLSFGDDSRLNYIDNELLVDYTQCNEEVLNTGEANHITMLNLRAECFERKGYEKVQLDYMKIKYQTYEI